MNKIKEAVKNFWKDNDVADVLDGLSLGITIASFSVIVIWGIISLILGVINFLMLDYVIIAVVVASVLNVGRMIYQDREWKRDDDEPNFL